MGKRFSGKKVSVMKKENMKRHIRRWKKRFKRTDIAVILIGMVLTITIPFLVPYAWILSVVTAYLTAFYIVIVALGI